MICKTCGVDYPETNFYRGPKKPTRHCKPCVLAAASARRRRDEAAHPERYAEMKRKAAETARAYRKTPRGKMRETLRCNAKAHGFAGNGVTVRQWVAILERFGYRCAYCNKDVGGLWEKRADQLTIDHDVPTSRGGKHCPDNVVPACLGCNSRKSTMTGEEFREEMRAIARGDIFKAASACQTRARLTDAERASRDRAVRSA